MSTAFPDKGQLLLVVFVAEKSQDQEDRHSRNRKQNLASPLEDPEEQLHQISPCRPSRKLAGWDFSHGPGKRRDPLPKSCVGHLQNIKSVKRAPDLLLGLDLGPPLPHHFPGNPAGSQGGRRRHFLELVERKLHG